MKRFLVGLVMLVCLLGVALLVVGVGYSGKKTVSRRVGVEQKPGHVFEVLTAFAKLPDMGIGIKSVKLPADATPRKGLSFDLETNLGPAKARVTELEADRTLGCDLYLKGNKLGNLRFELEESEGTGTDVTITFAVDSPPPLGGLYNLTASRASAAALDANLDKIKETLETVK